MTMLAAALAYSKKLSLHVFPIAPGRKVPFSSHAPKGFLSASTDESKIINAWNNCPEANIGIACALSGIVVIDVDPRNGGDDALGKCEKEFGKLPATWTALTPGGGSHYYFKDVVGDYIGKLAEGLDIKYNGYVLAPPSVAVGKTYAWDAGAHPSDQALAALPDAWLDHMTKRITGIRALPSSGDDARESYLGTAFEFLGWLGGPVANGMRMVRCPWMKEHSDGRGNGQDTSTVLFPRANGRSLGGFRCAHGHCAARTWKDVMLALPPEAHAAAKRVSEQWQPKSIWDEEGLAG